jgi:hypothetical protein
MNNLFPQNSDIESLLNNIADESILLKKETNAHIYIDSPYQNSERYHQTFLILPDSNMFNYLNYYPITAFNFVNSQDDSKISRMKIEDLKKRELYSLSNSSNIKFNHIKGFELYDDEIASADEFLLKEKQQFYINKLTSCWIQYKNEYMGTYLKGINGTYIFPELNENSYANEDDKRLFFKMKTDEKYFYWSYYFKMDKTAYNFDQEKLKISTFDGKWGYQYAGYLRDSKEVNFSNDLEMNVPISVAKQLFGDNEPCFYESIVTVMPLEGYKAINIGWTMHVLNYEVLKIKKNFYKMSQWSYKKNRFIGNPIYTLILESTDKTPLGRINNRVLINSMNISVGRDEYLNTNMTEDYSGTYTLYNKYPSIKKVDLIISKNPSTNKLEVNSIEYKGRSGSKKNAGSNIFLSGNILYVNGIKYDFVEYNKLKGLIALLGSNFIFLEKTK